MRPSYRSIQDEHGMVLFVCLTLLSVLTAVAVGALVAMGNDFKISANLRSATAAFYLADSGIEWAKQEIGASVTNPPELRDGAHSYDVGSFTVSFAAPARVTSLIARSDVRSVGSTGNASEVIRARLNKEYELADAALGLRGYSHGVRFDGAEFLISGVNHDAQGAPVESARSRSALSVTSLEGVNELRSNLNTLQAERIVGGNRIAAIRRSQQLASDKLARLAVELCDGPVTERIAVPSGGLAVRDRGWGKPEAGELRCLSGLGDQRDPVTLAGNVSGAGILVVRDAELVVAGSLSWHGWVVISGENVGFRLEGQDRKEVLGAVIINETSAGSGGVPATLDLRGAGRILYSHNALGAAASLIPAPVLSAAYPILPFTVTLDFWKTVDR